tara:strand:+ start:2297 stop:2962 length:666 start_codon:yes stop_codon:yes gene_type:complete
MNNVLVIAAHPDDELLGCGGTLIRHIEKQDIVDVLFLADGESSRNIKITSKILKERRENAKKVANFIGFRSIKFLNFPDNQLDKIPLLKIVKKIEKNIKINKSNIIYTHSIADLNIDHKIAFTASLTASRPFADNNINTILTFETPSSTEWSNNEFTPDTFINIENYISKKIEALNFYKKEMRSPPHPRSLEMIKKLSELRGSQSGFKFAESFKLVKKYIN